MLPECRRAVDLVLPYWLDELSRVQEEERGRPSDQTILSAVFTEEVIPAPLLPRLSKQVALQFSSIFEQNASFHREFYPDRQTVCM